MNFAEAVRVDVAAEAAPSVKLTHVLGSGVPSTVAVTKVTPRATDVTGISYTPADTIVAVPALVPASDVVAATSGVLLDGLP